MGRSERRWWQRGLWWLLGGLALSLAGNAIHARFDPVAGGAGMNGIGELVCPLHTLVCFWAVALIAGLVAENTN